MPPETDRHDRSRRFIRAAFGWEDPPTDDLLMEAAAALKVTFRLSDDSFDPMKNLITLAAANMLLRLPFQVCFAIPRTSFDAQPPEPYKGRDLQEAIQLLAQQLSVHIDFARPPKRGGTSILIESQWSSMEVWLGVDSWVAYLGRDRGPNEASGNSLSAYAAAAAATAETVRAWARTAAAISGFHDERLQHTTRPTRDCVINLWRPGTREMGPPLERVQLPTLDWVGGGAVTQAALCVLLGLPNTILAGRIFDPKKVDEPDLNRSILAFSDSLDLPKSEAICLRLSADADLTAVNSKYPPVNGAVAPWIICGADDVSVRPACQSLWPDQLLVIATQDQFAQVSRHSPTDGHFCGGCFTQAPISTEPAPTIGSTSVLSGAFGAASLVRLAVGDSVPARTELLTMRLDASTGISEVTPAPNPTCSTCGGRRQIS